jgi:hypothetical protein
MKGRWFNRGQIRTEEREGAQKRTKGMKKEREKREK